MKKVLILILLLVISGCAKKSEKVVLYKYDPKQVAKEKLKVAQANTPVNPKHPNAVIDHSKIYDKETIEIGEKLFITQINDIFYNFEDYKDKIIIVEGMFKFLQGPMGEKPAVYRIGPGCCNNDGWGGFLLKNYDKPWPKENDWIRVTGTPELVKEGRFQELYLNVTDLEVKDVRGAEYVQQ